MKIKTIYENIKCDIILCFQNAKYEILTDKYEIYKKSNGPFCKSKKCWRT